MECFRKNIFPRIAFIGDLSTRKNSFQTIVWPNLSAISPYCCPLKLAGISNWVANLPIYNDLYHLLGQFMQSSLKLVKFFVYALSLKANVFHFKMSSGVPQRYTVWTSRRRSRRQRKLGN